MKGVLLAGGTGSRLRPVTDVTNKHLLPVFDRPMIDWPLLVFRENGIREVLVVSGREHVGDVVRLLGSGRSRGFDFTFRVQDEAGGIAQAVALSEPYTAGGPVLVALGDNVFIPPPQVRPLAPNGHARVWLKRVADPQRYGVPVFLQQDGVVVLGSIEEKPAVPRSPYAVVGLYLFGPSVFDVIRTLRPSARGELEVTDLNNVYAANGNLEWEELPGYWGDAGESLPGLLRVSEEVRREIGVEAERRAFDVTAGEGIVRRAEGRP